MAPSRYTLSWCLAVCLMACACAAPLIGSAPGRQEAEPFAAASGAAAADDDDGFASRVDSILERLTLDEMISLMSTGSPAVQRDGLNISAFNWWSECLHGVVEGEAAGATVFPQPIGLAASFDAKLVERVASAIGDEARAKSNEAEAAGRGPRCAALALPCVGAAVPCALSSPAPTSPSSFVSPLQAHELLCAEHQHLSGEKESAHRKPGPAPRMPPHLLQSVGHAAALSRNCPQDPRWGRGSETYGEDPTLTAELARAYVRCAWRSAVVKPASLPVQTPAAGRVAAEGRPALVQAAASALPRCKQGPAGRQPPLPQGGGHLQALCGM